MRYAEVASSSLAWSSLFPALDVPSLNYIYFQRFFKRKLSRLPGVRIELTTPYRRPDLKSGALTTRPTWLVLHMKNYSGNIRLIVYQRNTETLSYYPTSSQGKLSISKNKNFFYNMWPLQKFSA